MYRQGLLEAPMQDEISWNRLKVSDKYHVGSRRPPGSLTVQEQMMDCDEMENIARLTGAVDRGQEEGLGPFLQ